MSMLSIASTIRFACIGAGLFGAALVAMAAGAPTADRQSAIIHDGKAGFVVSDIGFLFSQEASATGACPNGMSLSPVQAYAQTPGGARRAGEDEFAYLRRVPVAQAGMGDSCLNPKTVQDPNFRTVTGPNVLVTDGIDLDGQDSRANGRAAPGTCAHDDFRSARGTRGVDNQLFRALGCVPAYQPSGQGFDFRGYMLSGAWGILITLNGVDDLRNDDAIEVGIFANADPIQMSASRVPLENVTYSMDQDPRFRAVAHGRIVNGVITTDPVDVRFHVVSNNMFLERHLRDARLRLTLGTDGALEGIMAGYMPVQEAYDMDFGYRTARSASGELAPLQLRQVTALGRSYLLGYSCQGVYNALLANADGHRDPKTGQCTSISTQYRLHAIPAFVVDTATRSLNADLQKDSSVGPTAPAP
jgi:hypothetical protein